MSDVKANALINIAATHMAAKKDRMNIEWKVIFTSIGLFISILALDFKNSISVSGWIVWSGCLAISFLGSGYLLFLHHSHLINKVFYIHAENQLVKVAQNHNHRVTNQPDIPKLNQVFSDREGVAWLWQTSAIFSFASICAYVVTKFNN